MVSFRLIVFGAVRIAEPMIRDENDQAVLPSRELLETVDEMPQATVSESYRVQIGMR